MIDFAALLPPGAGLWWSQGSAEPVSIVDSLLDQVGALGSRRAFCGITWNRRLTRDVPEGLDIVSYGGLGELKALSRAGHLEVVPCRYSALPRLFAEGLLPRDVGLVQVSPPDFDGMCSLGIGVDYAADAVPHTRTLIAEINAQMPATLGSPRIPRDRFAAVVETDRALVAPAQRPADDVDRSIAAHIASLVDDGATIQIGVGSLPAAVLDALSGHRELGVHSGLITDGVAVLVEKGVITGSRKEIDPGMVVTGTAIGTPDLYAAVPDLPIRFRPVSYTHAAQTLARLRTLVSINSAIEVDLTGQVGAEVVDGAYVGAVGGQTDFSSAAAATGARSIIALRSVAGGRSTITPALRGAVVTTARSDVDAVVTEHGIAHLRGRGLGERARALIAVAAPEWRERLERSWTEGDQTR